MRRLALLTLLLAACADRGTDAPRDPTDAAVPDAVVPDGGDTTDAGATDAGGSVGARDAGGATDAGAGACASGLERWGLAAIEPLPPASALSLPNLLAGTQVVAAGATELNVRLELCRDGGAATLRSVLYRGSAFETPSLYRVDPTITQPTEAVVQTPEGTVIERRLPPSALRVEGLAAAVAGDPRALEVRLLGTSGLVLRGHTGFVALATGRVDAQTIEYDSINVVVGTLVARDVFANLECPFGETPLAARFALGTADFSVRACTFQGGGETFGYRIIVLTVTDTNPALTPAERQPITFTGDAAVRAVMNYAWHHHNGCDSFHLALPHADYAATASPLAGCGPPVPNAPAQDPEGFGDTLYRVRYRGGAWVEGSLPGCRHYLLCGG